MSAAKDISGSCLCGKVHVSVKVEHKTFDACHCGMCRKWAGSPLMTVEGSKGFQVKGEENITRYNSSDWAERGFCKNCGTHLFYHMKGTDFYTFSLGLFENVDQFKFQTQIYIDAKPGYYDFANKTEMMTEAEVIAKFNSTPPP